MKADRTLENRMVAQVPLTYSRRREHFTPIPDIEPELRREARKRVVKAWFWAAGIALLGLALWVAERWKP